MRHTSEARAEAVARELLTIRGWRVARPPKGNVLWKNEYRDYPEILEALSGKGKRGKGGDAYPDFIVVDLATRRPVIVGETKAQNTQIELAIFEATTAYADPLIEKGFKVLAAGIAGHETSNIAVRVKKRSRLDWKSIEYRGKPIEWLPTPEETERLLLDDEKFDLQPRVPSNEILAKRGEEINRILRECTIKDEFRPAVIGAFMLALWQSQGQIRTDPEHVLSDINTECRRAFIKAEKGELAASIQVPEANQKLAARAAYICYILRLLNVTTLTAEHDYLGQLYETFFRFTGGNTIGQFFTPRHITRFMADLTAVSREDFLVDPTCGTGGFLVAALGRMTEGKPFTREELRRLVREHLLGFESEPITAALCVANMILRGDGTTGVVMGDCFTHPAYPEGRATVVLGNPPFPHKKTDDPPEKFVDRGLEALGARGKLAMIVPGSQLVKAEKKKWRAQVLRHNSLKAVITLPSELFQPYASSTTAIIVLERGIPHADSTRTFFCRVENDGYRLKKNVRIEQPGNQLPRALWAYQTGESVPGFCGWASLRGYQVGEEWAPGAYIEATAYAEDVLQAEIDSLLRSLAAFHAKYAPQLASFRAALDRGDLTPQPYATLTGKKVRPPREDTDRIGGLFDIYYGQKALHNKETLQPGNALIISSAGSDNGCYGFFGFDKLIAPPFVTVPSTGSIGEAFVQVWPCGVTDDCLLLIPREGTEDEDLYIAAATVRLERWRFNYGRKMTPDRIADMKLNRSEGLKDWIRQRRGPAESLMVGILETLAGRPDRRALVVGTPEEEPDGAQARQLAEFYREFGEELRDAAEGAFRARLLHPRKGG
ncbi:MAG TPA: N-6 DNA methylase [bacterium]|nr:N-6 DNA methylase [bacterium]